MSKNINLGDAAAISSFSLITPLGNDSKTILTNALAGSLSGMHEDIEYLQGRKTIVGRITRPLPVLDSRFSHFNYRANRLLAMAVSKVENDIERIKSRFRLDRIGVILATSTAGVDSLENALPKYDKACVWDDNYKAHHQRMGSVSEFVSCYLGVHGPCMTVSTACSSANKAFASARRWLNAGLCDAVICGGVDILTQLTLRGFESLGALSSQQSTPFSKNRSGINIGEGAALFVLTKESSEYAFLGCGESSDAYHISAPNPNADGAVSSMKMALADACISTNDIDYVNLHGTGTKQNDAMEATAIHRVFAERGATIACSSSKPQLGHTLGVSGALELGLSLLSMSSENLNNCYLPHCYDGEYDDEISPLNLVGVCNNLGRPSYILSNSFAFGGSNSTVIVGKC